MGLRHVNGLNKIQHTKLKTYQVHIHIIIQYACQYYPVQMKEYSLVAYSMSSTILTQYEMKSPSPPPVM